MDTKANQNKTPKDILSILLDIGIFISFFITGLIRGFPFEFYFHYVFFIFLYPIMLLRYGLSARFWFISLSFLFVGFYHVFAGNNLMFNLIKVWFGVFLPYSFYYMYIKHIKYDIHRLFKMYINGAIFSSILAVMQEFFYVLHFSPGYNFSVITHKGSSVYEQDGGGILGRVSGMSVEPSMLAMLMAPAVFIVILSFFQGENEFKIKPIYKLTIILGYFATFSSTAYMGIGVIILLLVSNFASFKYILGTIILGSIVFPIALKFDAGVKRRIDSMREIMSVDLSKIVNKSAGVINPELYTSSLVWYNNFDVAVKNFSKHPLTGTGVGSHEVAFWRYSFFRFLKDVYSEGQAVNDKDANSLFNRLMSETGLMGLGLMFYIIFFHYVRYKKEMKDKRYWIYSNAILVIIILFLLRQGSYFVTGFPCFVWMYYFNHLHYKKELEQKKLSIQS